MQKTKKNKKKLQNLAFEKLNTLQHSFEALQIKIFFDQRNFLSCRGIWIKEALLINCEAKNLPFSGMFRTKRKIVNVGAEKIITLYL
jgi:hypothetical protein